MNAATEPAGLVGIDSTAIHLLRNIPVLKAAEDNVPHALHPLDRATHKGTVMGANTRRSSSARRERPKRLQLVACGFDGRLFGRA